MSDGRQVRQPKTTGRLASARRLAAVLAALLLLAACATTSVTGWQQVGGSSVSGVSCLVADPFNSAILYGCAPGGQVYRWRADSSGQPFGGTGLPDDALVTSLAADIHTSGRLYAGTSAGLFVTADHGDTWQRRGAGLPAGDTVDALALAPGDTPSADTLYAGTPGHGVYVSRDAGQSFSPSNDGLPSGATVDTLFWDAPARTTYVALDKAGVFALLAGSQSWSPRGSLPAQIAGFAALATGNGPMLYAATSGGAYSSADGGLHWSAIAKAPQGQVGALAGDPLQPTWLYAGIGSSVYRSEDAGQSWAAVAPALNQSVAAVVAVAPSQKSSIVFAAASNIYRFPALARPPASPAETIFGLLAFAAVVAVAAWAVVRSRRQLVELDRNLRTMGSPRSQAAPPSQQGNPDAPGRTGDQRTYAQADPAAPGDEPLPRSNGHRERH